MLCSLLIAGSCALSPHATPSGDSADATFTHLATTILQDYFAHHPSDATDFGIHAFDNALEDYSATAIHAESDRAKHFRAQLMVIVPTALTPTNALDQQFLVHVLDARVLELDTIRSWQKDPDLYSSGVTNAAFVIIKRDYAPAEIRLKALIARERQMPTLLAQARRNLTLAVPIYTQIAIEQIDGNLSFFANDIPAAFATVKNAKLLAELQQTNTDVVAALNAYKVYLETELAAKATTDFAYGADTFSKALAADEMVTLPIEQLLAIAERDRQQNDAALRTGTHQLHPDQTADAVLAALQEDHPPAGKLLQVTQQTLDAIRQFILDHHIVTIPDAEPVLVHETPPFLRATTSASMDTPGPFETAAVRAYYNMTLPDPRDPPAAQADFMRQWYYALISNVSVHEVYPGHYIQFLYAKNFPSSTRKVFFAGTNAEGWAHYCEQMMLDEGFHAGDPAFRIAQLQDALLRDVRLIAGIKLHTQGMTLEAATKLFETQAYQPHAVALAEAKRGTSDALYGRYTLGKLMIMKLRNDYRAKLGRAYTLQGFHDALMRLGPLPLPLVRRALLGESLGELLGDEGELF